MDDTLSADSLAQPSWPLSLLAFAVAVLAAHVAFGCLRQARYASLARWHLMWLALGPLALGAGLTSSMLLAVASQGLAFPIGYQSLPLAGAAGLATAAGAFALGLLQRWPRAPLALLSGSVVAAGLLAADALLIRALGLRPGLVWREDAVIMAGLALSVSAVVAFWLVFAGPGRRQRHAPRWRWAAAALVAVGAVAAQELMLSAAGLAEQTSSDHAYEVSAVAAGLVAGMGVPALLLLAEAQLYLKRHAKDLRTEPARRRRRVRVGRHLGS